MGWQFGDKKEFDMPHKGEHMMDPKQMKKNTKTLKKSKKSKKRREE